MLGFAVAFSAGVLRLPTAPPKFINIMLRRSNVILSGAGDGTNPDYTLLVSTNFALLLSNWMVALAVMDREMP